MVPKEEDLLSCQFPVQEMGAKFKQLYLLISTTQCYSQADSTKSMRSENYFCMF